MIFRHVVVRAAAAILLSSATSLSLSAIPQKAEIKPQCQVDPGDYAIFSALLNMPGGALDPQEGWPSDNVIIVATTSVVPSSADEGRVEAGAWGRRRREGTQQLPSSETVKDFYSKAGKSCSLQHLIDYPRGYRFITQEELEEFFKKGGSWWPGFYKKYPKAGGFWKFSLVGYNAAKSEAIVYVGHHCGGLCGTGTLYLLTQESGRWSIKNRLLLWIS